MSDFNPYAPPQSNPIAESMDGLDATLASPWIRLAAQLLDGLAAAAAMLPLMYFSGHISRLMANAESGRHDVGESLLWTAIGLVVYVAINWVFLKRGQTIGKMIVKIRIVKKDGSAIAAGAIILRRLLPVYIANAVPFLGAILVIIDALLIFRAKRNTLHDDIADTKVIQLR